MAGGAFALAADPSLLARTLGIEGGYNIEAVPPEGFAEFILHLSGHGFVGANVTRPHKERALALSAPDRGRARSARPIRCGMTATGCARPAPTSKVYQ